MESRQADFKLKQTEQQTILDTISAYFDFIFKTKNQEFNLSNVNLFERQVESDSARLQKGEITLTDLAQANLQNVLLLWQGLGYYSRAKRIHQSSKLLVEFFNVLDFDFIVRSSLTN